MKLNNWRDVNNCYDINDSILLWYKRIWRELEILKDKLMGIIHTVIIPYWFLNPELRFEQ